MIMAVISRIGRKKNKKEGRGKVGERIERRQQRKWLRKKNIERCEENRK